MFQVAIKGMALVIIIQPHFIQRDMRPFTSSGSEPSPLDYIML